MCNNQLAYEGIYTAECHTCKDRMECLKHYGWLVSMEDTLSIPIGVNAARGDIHPDYPNSITIAEAIAEVESGETPRLDEYARAAANPFTWR